MNPDGQAFPSPLQNGEIYPGLTIRQYYEIECLKAMLSSSDLTEIYASADMPAQALRIADALIRAQQARDEQEKKS